MANDCLVTKLKGVVNNNSLGKLGEYIFEVTGNTGVSNITCVGTTEWRCVGDCYFTNEAGTANYGQSVLDSGGVYIKGNGYTFAYSKYVINNIVLVNQSKIKGDFIDMLKNCPNNASIRVYGSGCIGVIGDIITKASELIPSAGVSGDISYLIQNSPNLTRFNGAWGNVNLNLSALDGKNVNVDGIGGKTYGDFSFMACNNRYNFYTPDASGVTGSIEGYVAKAISLGKTSGTYDFGSVSDRNRFSGVTYNGISIATSTDIPSGCFKFTWDAQGNVTWS